VSARPPEKGIFPLDHFGECKQVRSMRRWGLRPAEVLQGGSSAVLMRYVVAACCTTALLHPHCTSRCCVLFTNHPQIAHAYMQCLRKNDAEASNCQELSRKYLECRMERCVLG